jgi:hypothetical protein
MQASRPSQNFHGLAEIQAHTAWEVHGAQGDPAFLRYDPAGHGRYDGIWPDFHLTAGSFLALDRGSQALPVSLSALLARFDIVEPVPGAAYDIGRYDTSLLPLPSQTPAGSGSPACLPVFAGLVACLPFWGVLRRRVRPGQGALP